MLALGVIKRLLQSNSTWVFKNIDSKKNLCRDFYQTLRMICLFDKIVAIWKTPEYTSLRYQNSLT